VDTIFQVPQEPLRRSTQAPGHHPPGYRCGELLQGNDGRIRNAISKPYQPVPEGLRYVETAPRHSKAPRGAETSGCRLRGDGSFQHLCVETSMSGLGYREKQESGTDGDRLVCRDCGHERVLTQAWIDELRARAPAMDCHNTELVSRFLHQFRCSNCQTKNVEHLQAIQEELDRQPADNDELSLLCAQCGETIPVTRLQAVPGTPFCVRCQEQFEHGPPEEKPAHCEQCGAKMVQRVRKSPLPTKYFLGCSNYPRCRFVIAGSW
jgi:DNA-directed RNA polymerase subunit RPC12/RpoP